MDSEFKKRMQLLDPSYVAPMKDRVQNRQPPGFHAEKPVMNEAGLEIMGDQRISRDLQEIYLNRMMETDALKQLEAVSGGAVSDAEITAMIDSMPKPAVHVYDESGADVTEDTEIHSLEELFKQRK